MRILTENGFVDFAVLIFELTDEQLRRVSRDKDFYKDSDFISECMNTRGDNAHCLNVISRDKNLLAKNKTILKELYKTLSWWDRDMKKFKITRSL